MSRGSARKEATPVVRYEHPAPGRLPALCSHMEAKNYWTSMHWGNAHSLRRPEPKLNARGTATFAR